MTEAISFEEWKAALNEAAHTNESFIQCKPDNSWLTVNEFCVTYRLARKHLYAVLPQGQLPAVKIPGIGWRINRTRFEKQLENGLYRRRVGDISS